jgi:hypothetical protein
MNFIIPILWLGSADGYHCLNDANGGIDVLTWLTARRANLPRPAAVDLDPKSVAFFRLSRPIRGALAIVTNVGAGCGGRGSVRRAMRSAGRIALRERLAARKTTAQLANGEVVWS